MSDLPVWKRALAVLGLLVGSVWLTVMSLQTIRVRCAPAPDGAAKCVHEVRYAGITTRSTPFAPSEERVSWHAHGKGNTQGTVDIRLLTGETLEITWLSRADAKQAAERLERDSRFALETGGPRWWLLFLLGTIPFMLSFIVPRRAERRRTHGPHDVAPVAKTKKAMRAARGREAKAAARRQLGEPRKRERRLERPRRPPG